MQKYTVFHFTIAPMSDMASDILSACLADAGFDSFEQKDTGVDAYIPTDDVCESTVQAVVADFILPDVAITYTHELLANQDWNEEWERESFRPIVIPKLCCIHKPETPLIECLKAGESVTYDVLIRPRMSFGSGSHETTSQLIEILLQRDFSRLRCLDMGCGTGILAICMALRGGSEVTAIDIEDVCVKNTQENLELNGLSGKVQTLEGDASAIQGQYDVIVANIHRNIIMHDLPTYSAHLKVGGQIFLSGFFMDDVVQVEQAARAVGIEVEQVNQRDGWAVMQCRHVGE